jgi:cell division protein FtsB
MQPLPLPVPLPPPAPRPPADPEERLLREVVTIGTLLKILLATGGLLLAIGAYEVAQLDKLRDQTGALQTTVSALGAKVDAVQQMVTKMDGQVDFIIKNESRPAMEASAARSAAPKKVDK